MAVKKKSPTPAEKTKRQREKDEVLIWLRKYSGMVTTHWAAYRAAKAGLTWAEFIKAAGLTRT